MDLAADRLTQLDNPTLTADERALIRCGAAADLIHAGQYEAARRALGDLWRGAGRRPFVEGLMKATAGEVLLQCGVLSSALGSARNLTGVQEAAKDLISEARRLFLSLNRPAKASEAQYELSVCYWRSGAFDEARVVLTDALMTLGSGDDGLKAKILIRRSLIETWACRYQDALGVLKEAEHFFASLSDAFKGRWHAQMGLALRQLGVAEGRVDYLDRAIIEYTAAIYHYELEGHERYCAVNLNNLAMLLYRVGRYGETHEHLDRAVDIFTKLEDPGNLAQVDETRARVLLAEQRYAEAERVIGSALQVFEQGGEQSCLADALTVQATVLAGLGLHNRSLAAFRRAMSVAAEAGAPEKAGHAALSLLEEHGDERLSEVEIYEIYCRADDLLKATQDMEDIRRLRSCARTAARRLRGAQLRDPGFSLPEAVRAYEARFIAEALEQARGGVSHAARLLGLSHHSSLAMILKSRHRQLLGKRTPAVPRRRSVIRKANHPAAEIVPRPASILHVEDNKLVADTVREMLELEGYEVDTCADGGATLKAVAGDKRYDLLIVDHDLPGADGIEVVRRARKLPHRRRTPIIMLSASDVESEAWRVGVDAFLRKPEDIGSLTAMVTRLLGKR